MWDAIPNLGRSDGVLLGVDRSFILVQVQKTKTHLIFTGLVVGIFL